uniref:Uncharacterized protein n=1 Tax=Lactuca sativa TaxID=4236 RepID=A0A9R1XHL2_LACSA|nr:hypothetical protein LSAT_V11C300124620 [Lactuca sativa]
MPLEFRGKKLLVALEFSVVRRPLFLLNISESTLEPTCPKKGTSSPSLIVLKISFHYRKLKRYPLAPDFHFDNLKKLRRRFLWGGSEEKQKINWVAWKVVLAQNHLVSLRTDPWPHLTGPS